MREQPLRLSRVEPVESAEPVAAAHRPAAAKLPDAIATQLGDLAFLALLAELETWPKPGLVSHVDQGSHDDMDHASFRRSAAALRPFYGRMASAGAAGAEMDCLRHVGRQAEQAMLTATGGVNTHRGAIFGLGLLCAAAGAVWTEGFVEPCGVSARPPAALLGATVRQRWGNDIMSGPIPLYSHGAGALRRYGAGGARAEAAAGFPSVLQIGLPALRRGRAIAVHDDGPAHVEAFFSLLAAVEDTNLLHRAGAAGLHTSRRAAADFLAAGGIGRPDWLQHAAAIHHDFVRRRLSPGGCADLLAATIFLDSVERSL